MVLFDKYAHIDFWNAHGSSVFFGCFILLCVVVAGVGQYVIHSSHQKTLQFLSAAGREEQERDRESFFISDEYAEKIPKMSDWLFGAIRIAQIAAMICILFGSAVFFCLS